MVSARDDPDATADRERSPAAELPRRGPRSGPGRIARAREEFYGPEDATPAVPAPRGPVPSPEISAPPPPGDSATPSPESGTPTGGTPGPAWPTRAVRDRASTGDPEAHTHRRTGPQADGAPTRPASRRTALLVAAGVLLLALGVVLGFLLASLTGVRAGASGAAPLPSHPAMLGQVLAVPDGRSR